MTEVPNTGNEVVENSPRLKLDDAFTFRCDSGRPCFGKCCRDVSILLTPYDVLRLKRALHLSSTDFLDQHVVVMKAEDKQLPVVFLKMDPETHQCPFVGAQGGCGVYADRPWACRMYPLGLAEPEAPDAAERRFYFVVREELCQGHDGACGTVRQWLEGQEIEPYEMMQVAFRPLIFHPSWRETEVIGPQKLSMFFMACYDLDRFRRFVLETRFLDLFDVDEFRVEALRTDDEELLEFAFDWLAFTLFHEKRMKVKNNLAPRTGVPAAGVSG
jgi:hypothetical protein